MNCFIHLLILVVITVDSELFTSIEYLTKAIGESQAISESLEDYIRLEEDRLSQFKIFSESLKRRQNELLKNPDDVIGNPLKIFKFVKLYGIDMSDSVESYLSSSNHQKLQMIVEKQKTYLPSREDVDGVIHGIARLQRTYKLSVEQAANGSIQGYNTDKLTAKDCHDIGDQMFEAGYMSHSLEWFDVSINKLKQDRYWDDPEENDFDLEEQCECGDPHITPYVSMVERKRSTAKLKFEEQRQNFTQDLDSLPEDIYTTEWKDTLREEFSEGRIEYFGSEITFNDYYSMFADALCRGDEVPSNMPDHGLYCTYINSHPLLILQPAKLEVMHDDPVILMYHDIITDKQIQSLKADVFTQLKHATVFDGKTNSTSATGSRVSRSHHLDDNHNTIRKLDRYAEAITGLRMFSEKSEMLQVANYGIGGHYVQHHDYFLEGHVDTLDTQQRLATLLYYLSDVQAGGATVFTKLGVRIPPIKGSAAFWLNLDVDLNGRIDTIHAGCPVLLGSKWIANKWITVAAQKLGCYDV